MQDVMEWIRNAWKGWLTYTDGGKVAALLIAAVLFLVLTARLKGPEGRLVLYAGVMTVLCICPVTAAGLMLYQTKFYDYQWIWSAVPVTAIVALGGTIFLTEQWKPGVGWKTMLRNGFVTVVSIAIVLLCGGLGRGNVDADRAEADRIHAEALWAQVQQTCGEDLCLWAPADLLEYARLDGRMQLLYGRNMWDTALNAYSYDTYTEEQTDLYQWMEKLDDWAITISVAEVERYVQKGFACGADCILLPKDLSDWLGESESETVLLERLGADDTREVMVLEEYYLLKLR